MNELLILFIIFIVFLITHDKLAQQYFSAETRKFSWLRMCLLIERSRVCNGHGDHMPWSWWSWWPYAMVMVMVMDERGRKTIVITGLGSVVACHFVRSTEGWLLFQNPDELSRRARLRALRGVLIGWATSGSRRDWWRERSVWIGTVCSNSGWRPCST